MKQVEERYISLLTDFGFKRILTRSASWNLPTRKSAAMTCSATVTR